MSRNEQEGRRAWRRLLKECAESTAAAPDGDIAAELTARGRTVDEAAQAARAAMERALADAARGLAEREYEQLLAAYDQTAVGLPESPEERRALLEKALRENEEARELVTLQYREFRELTDADVESCLRQLAALGALDLGDRQP